MGCELCGKDAKLSKAIVEGIIMSVCKDCVKYGEAIEVELPVQVLKRKIVKRAEEEMELIRQDIGEIVKREREKRELTQEKLAQAIAEKESLIQRIEGGFEPTIKVARKLEQFLGVKIIVKEPIKKKVPVKKGDIDFKDSGLTIGDLLKRRK